MKSQFENGETVILNQNAQKGLPERVGERCTIIRQIKSINYDFDVEFDDGMISPVKYNELNKLTDEDKQYMNYIFTGNKVYYAYVSEPVKVLKVDYIHKKAELEFNDNSCEVVDFDNLYQFDDFIETIHNEKLEEFKINIHEDLLNIFFEHYRNQDDTYTIPKELLVNMLKGLYME
jgi:hypothetical protein